MPLRIFVYRRYWFVIPGKSGSQTFEAVLDPGLRRGDNVVVGLVGLDPKLTRP